MKCDNGQKARETGNSGLQPDAELQEHMKECATCREAYQAGQDNFRAWYNAFGDDCL